MAYSFEHVSAIAALHKIVEIKRLHLREDFAYLRQTPLVDEINEEAVATLGVDLFAELTASELAIYETFLERKTKDKLLSSVNAGFVAEEITLLNRAQLFPLEDFRSFNISLAVGNSSSLSVLIKHLGITKPTLITWARTAYVVQVIDFSERVFLVATRVELRSKPAILLLVLHETQVASTLRIGDFFLFKPNNQRVGSPARLFLQAINKYGSSLSIGGITKKFFFEGRTSSLNFNPNTDINFPLHESFAVNVALLPTPTGYQYNFSYAIKYKLRMSDFASGAFI